MKTFIKNLLLTIVIIGTMSFTIKTITSQRFKITKGKEAMIAKEIWQAATSNKANIRQINSKYPEERASLMTRSE
jgi:hypothetical protein